MSVKEEGVSCPDGQETSFCMLEPILWFVGSVSSEKN
jgi:hypothetical protein